MKKFFFFLDLLRNRTEYRFGNSYRAGGILYREPGIECSRDAKDLMVCVCLRENPGYQLIHIQDRDAIHTFQELELCPDYPFFDRRLLRHAITLGLPVDKTTPVEVFSSFLGGDYHD